MNATRDVKARLDRLRDSPCIDAAGADLTMKHPERLRDVLGPTFAYFGRVESEVAAEPLLVLMPRLGTEYGGYRSHGAEFLEIWVGQEQAHGQIFDRLLHLLGLEPFGISIETGVVSRVAGRLGRLSESIHAVFEMVYLTRGAMHEKLTAIGYARMAAILSDLGETGLLESIIAPIRIQEAGHLGFYRQAALDLKAHLQPWQLRLARAISVLTYAPVGAHTPQQKADFGDVAIALAGERVDEFIEPVAKIAESLLRAEGRSMPPFVSRSLNACMALACGTERRQPSPSLSAFVA